MLLPEIKSSKKIRDFKICQLWLESELTTKEIANRFNLSTTQINRIIYKNRGVLELDKKYEKSKRIRWLKKQIAQRPTSKKDTAELMDMLRKEIEGDKPLVDNSVHTHYVYEWSTDQEHQDKLLSPALSKRRT